MIDLAIKNAQAELKKQLFIYDATTCNYSKKGSDIEFTEYTFISGGYEDHRRYLNVRLRNRTEELMSIFFAMAEL